MRLLFSILISSIILNAAISRETVSVLYFDNTTGNSEFEWLKKGICDMLITDLAAAVNFKIIEREALEKVLQEQALALTGLVGEEHAVKVGELLQAEKLIHGAYIVTGSEIRIDLKISAVASGEILFAAMAEGDLDDIFAVQQKLSTKIIEQLAIKTAPAAETGQNTTLPVIEKYYRGIDHLDNGRYEKAREAFEQARTLDPLFYKAQQGLTDAYKFLKAFKAHRQQRDITELYKKVKKLKSRLHAESWITFAQIVQSEAYAAMSPREQQEFNQAHTEYMICNTPAQCTWHIMLTLDEIGRRSVEYFDDLALQTELWQKNVTIAENAAGRYGNEPFLPEIKYFQLLAFHGLKDHQRLKQSAERLMMDHPDYRMIESVEDFYQKALDALAGEQ